MDDLKVEDIFDGSSGLSKPKKVLSKPTHFSHEEEKSLEH
jgi:hypothetical protein